MTMWKTGIALLIILVLAFFFWVPDDTPIKTSDSDSQHSQAAIKMEQIEQEGVDPSQNGDDAQAQASVFAALKIDQSSTSLKGTDIDGMYPVDAQGNLILTADIKHRFEYFLSTLGEFELDQVLDMIREDIRLNLNEPALSQAMKLFDDYVTYKQALAELEQKLSASADYEQYDIQNIRYRLEQLRDKRREYLSDEAADAFFGFDELYDDYMLSKLEIINHSQLTESEKQAQISALEQQLPPQLQDMRDETDRISKVFNQVEALKQRGASQEEIYQANETAFGQEAALRIQALDEKRANWQQRVDAYMTARQAIEQDDALSATMQTEQIESLKQRSFSASEQRRLKAFELMANEQK